MRNVAQQSARLCPKVNCRSLDTFWPHRLGVDFDDEYFPVPIFVPFLILGLALSVVVGLCPLRNRRIHDHALNRGEDCFSDNDMDI